jgi:hypothetical protein
MYSNSSSTMGIAILKKHQNNAVYKTKAVWETGTLVYVLEVRATVAIVNTQENLRSVFLHIGKKSM